MPTLPSQVLLRALDSTTTAALCAPEMKLCLVVFYARSESADAGTRAMALREEDIPLSKIICNSERAVAHKRLAAKVRYCTFAMACPGRLTSGLAVRLRTVAMQSPDSDLTRKHIAQTDELPVVEPIDHLRVQDVGCKCRVAGSAHTRNVNNQTP